MSGTFKVDDVTILLKDVTGKIAPSSVEEREKNIANGGNYSALLPEEYVPTEKYLSLFMNILDVQAPIVAHYIKEMCEKIAAEHKPDDDIVLVSLARAGTPIGVLAKRYFEMQGRRVFHYTVSIIKGIGLDMDAMNHILFRHAEESIQFVDGWVGSGNIQRELSKAIKENNLNVSDRLAVVSNPSSVDCIAGTTSDILVPNACLNATVSGMMSRTIYNENVIQPGDFHGVVYYDENEMADYTNLLMDKIEYYFTHEDYTVPDDDHPKVKPDVLESILAQYPDIAKKGYVKFGAGETMRVLLRRKPALILVNTNTSYVTTEELNIISELAEERNVPVENSQVDLGSYKFCGIINSNS